jgi:hypothetical protein
MRITRTASALVLAASLGLLGACASDGGRDDAVASLDDAAAASADDGDTGSDDGGGGGGRPDSSEFEDAALEFAQCMRDHGIDMPDPQIDSDGGRTRVQIGGGPGQSPELGPDGQPSEEFQAAQEACQPILEEAAPEMQLTPEEQAEMQDRLVEMAECMRERGHDMPDPQVGEGGMVTIGGGPGQGGPVPGSPEEDEFMADMEECSEEAGMPEMRTDERERGDGDSDESDT